VVEVAGDELERAGVEDGDQLLVGEAEPILKLRGVAQDRWVRSGCGTPPP